MILFENCLLRSCLINGTISFCDASPFMDSSFVMAILEKR